MAVMTDDLDDGGFLLAYGISTQPRFILTQIRTRLQSQ